MRSWLGAAACAAAVTIGCDDEEHAAIDQDGAVDADTDAGPWEADGEADGETPALTPERDNTVKAANRQVGGFSAANQVLSLFVKQDPTLDLAQDACANAGAISARVQGARSSSGAICASATAACQSGSATVSAALSACAVGDSGASVSGTVATTVSKSGASGTTSLSVSLALSQVVVTTGDDSYVLAGTISTTTSDLTSYAVHADLTVDAYAVTFDGRVAASESASGELEGLTLDGAGTMSGPSMTEAFGSWTCMAPSVHYAAAGLQRSLAQCRADRGTLTLEESYTCTSTVTSRGKAPRTVSSTAAVTDVVTWDANTPTTGVVHVATASVVAGQTTNSSKEVTLPGDCP